MQDELKRPLKLGEMRELICSLCTERNHKPLRRQHIYGEIRSWRHREAFWECTACRHKIPLRGD